MIMLKDASLEELKTEMLLMFISDVTRRDSNGWGECVNSFYRRVRINTFDRSSKAFKTPMVSREELECTKEGQRRITETKQEVQLMFLEVFTTPKTLGQVVAEAIDHIQQREDEMHADGIFARLTENQPA